MIRNSVEQVIGGHRMKRKLIRIRLRLLRFRIPINQLFPRNQRHLVRIDHCRRRPRSLSLCQVEFKGRKLDIALRGRHLDPTGLQRHALKHLGRQGQALAVN